MGFKKGKSVKMFSKPKTETVKIVDLVRDYNDILDGKSKLSSQKREIVKARVAKLIEKGLLKTQNIRPIEAANQIINGSNTKDIN